ncbi:hypothetical protein [Arthrobacter pigmenti]
MAESTGDAGEEDTERGCRGLATTALDRLGIWSMADTLSPARHLSIAIIVIAGMLARLVLFNNCGSTPAA